jgi:Pyruvate/2-oxoacid:ferredoxin oxidoreductase delta subunit
MKPYIIKRKCPAQKDICKALSACPRGAIHYVADEQEPLGGRMVFDYDKCDGCGLCVTECCGAAIELRLEK